MKVDQFRLVTFRSGHAVKLPGVYNTLAEALESVIGIKDDYESLTIQQRIFDEDTGQGEPWEEVKTFPGTGSGGKLDNNVDVRVITSGHNIKNCEAVGSQPNFHPPAPTSNNTGGQPKLITIIYSPVKLCLFSCIIFSFGGGCILALFNSQSQAKLVSMEGLFLAVFGIACLGFGASFLWKALTFRTNSVITLSADGIRDIRLGYLVPWRDITGFFIMRYKFYGFIPNPSRTAVVVNVRNPNDYLVKGGMLSKFTSSITNISYESPIALMLSMLRVSPNELLHICVSAKDSFATFAEENDCTNAPRQQSESDVSIQHEIPATKPILSSKTLTTIGTVGGVILIIIVGISNAVNRSKNSDARALNVGVKAYESGDYATAYRLWLPLAESGDSTAEYDLGLLFYHGLGVSKNLNEAAKWFKKASDAGDANAQNQLGDMYDNGEGVEKNFNTSLGLYKQAAEKGNSEAQFSLGFAYKKGRGTNADLTEALKWFRAAADQGNSEAQDHLGLMYEFGNGVPENAIVAYMWYYISAKNGFEKAKEDRDRIAASMTSAQIAEGENMASKWQKR